VGPPAYAEGYEPAFYDGYVVYYDDVGRPFCYRDGVAAYVPPESPYYGRYVQHWRVYAPTYRRWYVSQGYRYRGYHRH
jgi:hypothetical protein